MKHLKHTIFSLNDGSGNTSIGDIVYLPEKWMSKARLGSFGAWLKKQQWFLEILTRRNQTSLMQLDSVYLGSLGISTLSHEWMNPSDNGPMILQGSQREPEWVQLLPKDAQRQIWKDYAIGGGIEPFAILPHFPFMGFGYIVQNEGDRGLGWSMANEAACVFNLHRLQGVKQLGFMRDPVGLENDRSLLTLPFQHTRYCHSLDAFAIATLLGENCKLTDEEKRVLSLAGLVHDARTPAGGDSTKLVDPAEFDEDIHFPEFLKGFEWEEFQAKWNIDSKLLVETVLGNGILGSLLDIADKTSYISRDAFAYLGMKVAGKKRRNSSPDHIDDDVFSTGLYTINDLINRHPNITALWEVTRIIQGKVVITDPDRLTNLLRLRALLFRELYYNPFSRFYEYLLGKGVTKILYERGEITAQELLFHNDLWLERKADKFFGDSHILTKFHNLAHSRIEEFHDYTSACRRAAEFDGERDTIVIVDDFQHVSNSATKRFWVKDRGQIVKFNEARPRTAEQIDRIMTFPSIKRLYFFHSTDLGIPSGSRLEVKEAFVTLRKDLERKILQGTPVA